MNSAAWLFLLRLWSLSYILISGFVAVILLRSWRKNGRSMMTLAVGLVFLSLCIDGCAMFIANTFGFENKPVYTTGYGWSFWSGKIQLSAVITAFGVYLFSSSRDTVIPDERRGEVDGTELGRGSATGRDPK